MFSWFHERCISAEGDISVAGGEDGTRDPESLCQRNIQPLTLPSQSRRRLGGMNQIQLHSKGFVAHCACTRFGANASKHVSTRAIIGINGSR